MKTKIVLPIIAVALLGGCQGNERLLEKAGLEGTVTADKQIEAENANLKRRSTELEADLAKRQKFFQAVSGTYEGTLETDQGSFNMRITLVSTVPPYASDRIRMPEEIVSDLNNLSISSQIVQWHPSNTMSATGCRTMGIRPNLTAGELVIASSDCPNFYTIKISDTADEEQPQQNEEGRAQLERKWLKESKQSPKLAQSILDGRSADVLKLVGQMKPTTNAAVYYFLLKRSEQ